MYLEVRAIGKNGLSFCWAGAATGPGGLSWMTQDVGCCCECRCHHFSVMQTSCNQHNGLSTFTFVLFLCVYVACACVHMCMCV